LLPLNTPNFVCAEEQVLAHQETDLLHKISDTLCVGNEYATKIVGFMDRLFSSVRVRVSDDPSSLEVLKEMLHAIHDLTRDNIACMRTTNKPSHTLGKVGYLLMNRSPCEKDIGLMLILIGEYLKSSEKGTPAIEKTILAAVSTIANTVRGFDDCKNEIGRINRIWGLNNSTNPHSRDDSLTCLLHAFGEEISSMLVDRPFLTNWVFVLNKIGLEIHSAVRQCEEFALDFSDDLSLVSKVAYTIIDRSKCERSLATILLIGDYMAQKDLSPYLNIFYTLLTADHGLNVYDNCQREVNLVMELFK